MTAATRAVQCKHCETRYKIPASFAGRTVKCRRCASPILVNRVTEARRTVNRRPTRRRGNPAPQKASPLQLASGVVSALIVVGIVVFWIAT